MLRLRSYAQYLLADPPGGNFASGLEFASGARKPSYDAYRLPLYMPRTSGRRGAALEVWGDARAAAFTGAQPIVAIQFQAGSHGPFTTVPKVAVKNIRGYFDVRVPFSGSGSVRLAWSDPLFGQNVISRTVKITLH